MNLSKLRVLIIEDSILKANDIKKALIYNGITNTFMLIIRRMRGLKYIEV